MLKTKIAVLISGGGTNLQALTDYQSQGKLKSGELSLVISSNENAFGLKRAEKAGIETQIIKKGKAVSQLEFETKLDYLLKEKEIELIVLAGFMVILSESFVSKYKNRIINVHPSLIPSFCGKSFYGIRVHEAALEYGVKVTGATVHYVNEIPDGGEIIYQKAVEILPGDTAETLQKRVMEQAEWELLPKATEFASKKIREEK
ncbi:MAG: phosphoribosylglycinamide formyltransferase [Aminipila sp.]